MKLEITKDEIAVIVGSLSLFVQKLDLNNAEHENIYNICEKLFFKIKSLTEKEGVK